MSSLISVLILVAAIAVIFFGIKAMIAYSKKKEYKPAISKMIYSLIAFFALIIILIPFSSSDSSKDSSSSSSSSKPLSKAESKKKASEDSYSKELSSARKKNKAIGLKQFKNKLNGITSGSHGTIDSIDFDNDSGVVNVNLSDNAVNSMNNDDLRSSCYTIWKDINQIGNSYNQDVTNVVVQDSSQHQFSHSSFTGDFKFDGK